MSGDDKAFRLTPKGWLVTWLLINANLPTSHGEKLWDELTAFVSKQAEANGMTEGLPCLVLVEGGHCITAEKNAEAH